jgi:hypothetical protein
MGLFLENGSPFSTGATPYIDAHPRDDEPSLRLVITVEIGGTTTDAIVDTGGVYCICDPDLLALVDMPEEEALDSVNLLIRGVTRPGALYRLPLTLIAEEGKHLTIETTAFVPQLQPDESWNLPTFLGLQGCLERLRFAVDPVTNTFFFGSIADDG